MFNATVDYGVTLPSDFLSGNVYSNNSQNIGFEQDEHDAEPLKEKILWQSVIAQAVFDATRAPVNASARKEKTKAIIWFSMQNKDFIFVCEMAGIDPRRVISGIKKVIKQSTVNNRRKSHMKRIRTVSNTRKNRMHEKNRLSVA